MKTAARRSPTDRDRAVRRLRTITVGAGLVSVVAVGGFGALAALSHDGAAIGVTTAAITTIDDVAAATQPTAASTTATAHATTGSS